MNNRLLLAVLVLVAFGWLTHRSPQPAPEIATLSESTPLPEPPRLEDEPIQRELKKPMSVDYGNATLELLAEYSLTGRILSKKNYRDNGADISRTDLALGWGMASQESVLKDLRISQGRRWYRYHSQKSHFPFQEFARHSANAHIIAASRSVQEQINDMDKDDIVSLQGFLVNVEGPNGFTWRSSLTRNDTGGGACELFYVLRVTR